MIGFFQAITAAIPALGTSRSAVVDVDDYHRPTSIRTIPADRFYFAKPRVSMILSLLYRFVRVSTNTNAARTNEYCVDDVIYLKAI